MEICSVDSRETRMVVQMASSSAGSKDSQKAETMAIRSADLLVECSAGSMACSTESNSVCSMVGSTVDSTAGLSGLHSAVQMAFPMVGHLEPLKVESSGNHWAVKTELH